MIHSEYALHVTKEVGPIRSKYNWKRFVDPPAGLIDLHSVIIASHRMSTSHNKWFVDIAMLVRKAKQNIKQILRQTKIYGDENKRIWQVQAGPRC